MSWPIVQTPLGLLQHSGLEALTGGEAEPPPAVLGDMQIEWHHSRLGQIYAYDGAHLEAENANATNQLGQEAPTVTTPAYISLTLASPYVWNDPLTAAHKDLLWNSLSNPYFSDPTRFPDTTLIERFSATEVRIPIEPQAQVDAPQGGAGYSNLWSRFSNSDAVPGTSDPVQNGGARTFETGNAIVGFGEGGVMEAITQPGNGTTGVTYTYVHYLMPWSMGLGFPEEKMFYDWTLTITSYQDNFNYYVAWIDPLGSGFVLEHAAYRSQPGDDVNSVAAALAQNWNDNEAAGVGLLGCTANASGNVVTFQNQPWYPYDAIYSSRTSASDAFSFVDKYGDWVLNSTGTLYVYNENKSIQLASMPLQDLAVAGSIHAPPTQELQTWYNMGNGYYLTWDTQASNGFGGWTFYIAITNGYEQGAPLAPTPRADETFLRIEIERDEW